MPIIKSISNYTPNISPIGSGKHINVPLSPMAKINASAPALADLLADEHSSFYSQENIELMLQALERKQAETLQPAPEMPDEPQPRKKRSDPEPQS